MVTPEAYVGISNTYNRYVQCLDEGNIEEVVNCFTDDGILIVEGHPERRGKAALRAQYDSRPPGRGDVKHIVGGIWVRDEHDGTAQIVAALILLSLQDGRITGTGNSNDTLQRSPDGVWRFVEKRVQLSWRA
jgi:hypothetical protein